MYGTPLTAFSLFKYLGRTFFSSGENCPAVEQNLHRAQGKWGRLENILVSEGADRRMVGSFYVAVVQAVLLFESNMWVLTPRLEKSLEGFHHQEVRQMAGMGPKHQKGWYMGVYTHWRSAGNGGA